MKLRNPFHSNAVWPSPGMVAFFAVAYLMLEVGVRVIGRTAGNIGEQVAAMPEIRNIRGVMLGVAAGCYAIFRVWRFHPACNLRYGAWLRTSPWTWRKSLPLGPVHLVWQDAVVIGVLAVVAQWHAHVNPVISGIVFGLVYLLFMTLVLAATRTWLWALVLGFLWPSLLLPSLAGPPGVIIFAAIVLVIWYGHRRSLQTFPWRRVGAESQDFDNRERAKSLGEIEIRVDSASKNPGTRNQSLGWPFQWLTPKALPQPMALQTSLSVSALFGWWTYCIWVSADWPASPATILVFAVFAALSRLMIYCSGLVPTFSIWGRLASGRLVIPGFDQVFVSPGVAVAVAILGGVWIQHSGEQSHAIMACVTALIWFVLLNGGPTMRRWILTGHHRYRSPTRLGANKQLVRRI